jgi:hypothetical protein
VYYYELDTKQTLSKFLCFAPVGLHWEGKYINTHSLGFGNPLTIKEIIENIMHTKQRTNLLAVTSLSRVYSSYFGQREST